MNPRPVAAAILRLYRFGLPWAVVAPPLAVGISTVAIHRYGTLDTSMWEFVGAFPVRWVHFVLGIVPIAVMLPVLVAHGITRRTYAVASGILGGLLATATGLYMMAGFLLERSYYDAVGVPYALDRAHLFDSAGQPHVIFAEYGLLTIAYYTSGWLVGVCYYRFGGVRGTACLPAALLPIAAMEYVLATGWFGLSRDEPLLAGSSGLPQAGSLVLGVAVAALGLVAGRMLVGGVQIPARKA